MGNVVFIVHTFDETQIGGVLKITCMQANELANMGFKVSVLSLGQVVKPAYTLIDKVELVCLNLKYYDTRQLQGVKKIFFFSKAYWSVLSFMKQQDRNTIFITTSPPINILFSLFDKRFKIIGCDHTATTYSKNGLTFAINLLKRRLDYMIGLTPQDTSYYKEHGITAKYIPNFIEENISSLNSSQKGNNVVFIGRFSKEKNPLAALRIFYKSRLYEKDIRFKMYGYGDLSEDIIDFVNKNNMQQYVSIIEGESDPDIMLKEACCLLLTSEIEGFGMVLLEAISKGVMCVSYDVGYGPQNIIQNGVNGFLVQKDREDDGVEKLLEVFKMTSSSKDKEIRNSIKQFYTQNVIKKWEELLRELSH